MSSALIISLIITGILGIAFVVLGIFMLFGRGANFIAGYNTMSKEEKSKYDSVALCKFMGKLIIPIGLATPVSFYFIFKFAEGGNMNNMWWVLGGYMAIVMGLTIFGIIYMNTGNRFRK